MTKVINLVVKGKEVFATSKQVAEDFGKNHNHVLRDIDGLKGVIQNWTDLFIEVEYVHSQNKQTYRMYNLTKDGFTLLAFGFNGKKAMQFKLDYINAFNDMEAQLKELDSVKVDAPAFDWEYFNVKFKTAQRIKKYFKDETDDLTKAYDNFKVWSRKRLDVKKRVNHMEHILVALDAKCKENGSISNTKYYQLREEVIALREQILRDIDSINNRSYGQKVYQAKQA